MRQINEIIIHCTATRPDWWKSKSTKAKVNEVRRWHVEDRGWSDIGYHFLIDRDGTVAVGRSLEKAGAHTKGHNANSIGIALFGGHGSANTDAFEDNFTPEQDGALRKCLSDLKEMFPDAWKVSGHNEFASKACPGFEVSEWLFDKKPSTIASSTTVQATGAATVATGVSAAAAVGELDGNAQMIVVAASVVAVLALAWIARERIKKWARGIH